MVGCCGSSGGGGGAPGDSLRNLGCLLMSIFGEGASSEGGGGGGAAELCLAFSALICCSRSFTMSSIIDLVSLADSSSGSSASISSQVLMLPSHSASSSWSLLRVELLMMG